ncbi:MAG: diadenylate cyclase CdaA [Clostridia bacterium]|nr:TIGR00159 family protein [Bacillota bacterium]MBO2521005.1 TIGR00159 family protein [Bacillota bacterium]
MPSFTVIDALDILLVAFFLFRLMMLIRGTRATAIIKGLAVLFVANLASGLLGLRTVNWILEQGTTVILVALPVVFYPELRRALEHLGRGQLFSRFSGMGQEEIARIVDPIARSARLLAESHTGALIVIERDVGLEEYVESGVRMDALLTTELLLNIFTPNTPLHDGAVIVRGDRVAAAGCFLPLTDNPYISSKMGTRHRAGLGVSEQSDALAVIVSEETGSISLAKAGRIERNLDEDTLRMRLARELQGTLGLGRRGGLG